MDFILYPDKSIFPAVRCISRIEGSEAYAEGVALSAGSAMEKCRSERIEREYRRLNSIDAIGIAAHQTPEKAVARAYTEALETLVLRKVAREGVVPGIHLKLQSFSLSILRVNGRWFSLLRGMHRGSPTYTYSCRKTLTGSVIHTWVEMRSIHFFKVKQAILGGYTKANQLFGESPLRYEFSLREMELDLPANPTIDQWNGRYIAYFKGEAA